MSTTIQKISLLFGIVFLAVGVLGFVMGGTTGSNITLLGLFQVNLWHNIVHVVFGVWGVVGVRSEALATQYTQIAGVVYLILALLGFFMPSGFGLVHLGGHNLWLHLLIGVVLIYFGFGKSLADADIMGGE
jgi:hypothetical protein